MKVLGIPLRTIVISALRLILIGVLLGWLYAWASPKVYPREGKLGFGFGCMHGALMPMALPSLAMGNDVEIFAANNNGRGYKLGYIIGINVCGMVFFGSAFWSPRKKSVKE